MTSTTRGLAVLLLLLAVMATAFFVGYQVREQRPPKHMQAGSTSGADTNNDGKWPSLEYQKKVQLEIADESGRQMDQVRRILFDQLNRRLDAFDLKLDLLLAQQPPTRAVKTKPVVQKHRQWADSHGSRKMEVQER